MPGEIHARIRIIPIIWMRKVKKVESRKRSLVLVGAPRGFEYHPLNEGHGSNKKRLIAQAIFSAPTGIRTPVVALKGLRPSPLDDGGIRWIYERADFIIPHCNGQAFCLFFLFCALSKERH